jgi:uncharacterized protein DUF7002
MSDASPVTSTALLASIYPALYHVAAAGAWRGIRAVGLMSAQRLIAVCGADADRQRRLLRVRRQRAEELWLGSGQRAVLRDQKPLNPAKLQAALGDRMTIEEWLSRLNSYVFMWPTEQRVETLLRAYPANSHDVLVLDTAGLLARHGRRTRLSHMNTGTTAPIAHPRGPQTFQTLSDYPLAERRRKYGRAHAVAEVVVEDVVPDVSELLLRIDRYAGTRFDHTIWHRRASTAGRGTMKPD